MGLFDSIRRVVGGGDDAASDDTATHPDLVDTRDLEVAALRERATGVADEVAVLDFSLSSLAQFDDAIDAGYDEDLATADEPGVYATDTVRFGCYLGEVLVRVYDGEWTQNPDWGVTVAGPAGETTVAVFDVAERSITTGAVFAAVADRAAGEVGLDDADTDAADGAPTDDVETDDPEREPEHTEAAVEDDPAATEPTEDEPTDSTPGAEPPDEGLTAGDPGETTSTADPFEDESAADTPGAPADVTSPDPEAVDRVVDDAESLIEEAEPESAADDAGVADPAPGDEADDADPAGQASQSTEGSDAAESPFDDETGTEPSEDTTPSLFDDDAAGTGPTVTDAPAADDSQPTGLSDSNDAPAETDWEGAAADDSATDGADGTDVPGDDPTAGDGLRATYAESAEELVTFWTEYDLDYTADSLDRLDALVSEEWDDDRFDDADFGSDDSFDDRVFTSVSTELGSYFGEVLVRELDAEWSDEATTDGVVVEGADGPLAIPVFKVAGTSIKQQPVFARSYDSLLSDLDANE